MPSNRLTFRPVPTPVAARPMSASSTPAWAAMPQEMSQAETPTRPGPAGWPVMLAIWDWERRWAPEHAGELPTMRHETCGLDFSPMLTCQACGKARR